MKQRHTRPSKRIEKNQGFFGEPTSTSELVLYTIATLGAVSLSLLMPNLIVAISKLSKVFRNLSQEEQERKIKKTFYYLKRSGKIKFKKGLRDFILSLTKKGKKRLKENDFIHLKITRPNKWDKRWWQVAADIPSKDYKLAADAFRHKIVSMGFYPLQRTLWYYPYDPRDELQLILNHFHIGKFVTIMEISQMDKSDEKTLRKYFRNIKLL